MRTGMTPKGRRVRPRDTICRVRAHVLITAILIGVTTAARPCPAQDSSRINDTVFSNPGARSIALGGAFAAIADDATAAFANPAGLVQILRPEISAELRFTAGLFDSGDPYESANGVSGLGFFSYVFPTRNWAFALYAHQVASLEFTYVGSYPLVYPLTRELSVRSFSGATAYQIGDQFSVGAGLSYYRGARESGSSAAAISDNDWGFNLGILWNAKPAWSIAGFYRQGPRFETEPVPLQNSGLRRTAHDLKNSVSAPELTFPDEYGVGIAYRPGAGGWTLGFEWDRVGGSVDPLLLGNRVTSSGNEYHFGAEYAVLRWKPVVAFRAGYWIDSGRRRDVIVDSEVVDTVTTETLAHVAFGFGLAFKRFQIDTGVDIYERAVVGSVSIVYSF
jgi:hypothetical protein